MIYYFERIKKICLPFLALHLHLSSGIYNDFYDALSCCKFGELQRDDNWKAAHAWGSVSDI